MSKIYKLLILLLLSGCGVDHNVHVSPVNGEVDIVHKIDIQGAIKQINQACQTQFPDDKNQQAICFQSMTNQFFKILVPTPQLLPTPP